MTSVSRNLKETATYWARTGTDEFSRPTFASPASIKCRWEDRAEVIRNGKGDEVVSKSRVFLANPVVFGGYLARGTFADANPTELDNVAFEIQQTGRQTDLRAMRELNVAYL